MNSPWHIELTKELRKRDNKEPEGATIGEVISVSPLKISVYGNNVILTDKQCYVCNSLLSQNANIVLDNVPEHGTVKTTCTITDVINDGDKVLCLPTPDGQIFFILDKVVV